jgi:peptide/nickel transport system permease protein
MVKYIIRRLLQAIPTFFGITVLAYLLMGLSGNPLAVLTFNPRTTPQERERVGEILGVNDPLWVQYLRWLTGDDWMRWDTNGDNKADATFFNIIRLTNSQGDPLPPGNRYGILRGDFGDSFVKKRPVMDLIFERMPATLELNIASFIIALTVGIGIGILAAVNRGGLFDNITRVLAVLFDAIPTFWLALILLLIFGAYLGWLPIGDRCRTTLDDSCPPVTERMEYLILPVFVGAVGGIAGTSRIMRASMLEVMGQDFIRTAFAKGLSSRSVWFKHGARNALIPIATGLGPAILSMLSGAVVIESSFNWPGVGRTTFEAATQRDYPIVMTVTVYAALVSILGYLLSDILYALIDPRIRFE